MPDDPPSGQSKPTRRACLRTTGTSSAVANAAAAEVPVVRRKARRVGFDWPDGGSSGIEPPLAYRAYQEETSAAQERRALWVRAAVLAPTSALLLRSSAPVGTPRAAPSQRGPVLPMPRSVRRGQPR